VNLIAHTTTTKGLRLQRLSTRGATYPLAVKVSDQQMAAVKICPAAFLGEWNYTIKPLSAPTQANPSVNEKDLLEWLDWSVPPNP
jgi:hypothetical protein